MIIKLAILLAILLIVTGFATWAFLPARHLPGNRARHLRMRLHLRLHPGKGFAHVFSLWLRWSRFAVLRRSGQIRPALPWRYSLLDPREHAVFLGRRRHQVTDVTQERDQAGAELSAADEQVLRELTERARTGGLKLTGEGGLLGRLTKMVIEGALEGELDDHLGYARHDPDGRDGGNSRNGRRAKTVITDTGPVELSVPRDRDSRLQAENRRQKAAAADRGR